MFVVLHAAILQHTKRCKHNSSSAVVRKRAFVLATVLAFFQRDEKVVGSDLNPTPSEYEAWVYVPQHNLKYKV